MRPAAVGRLAAAYCSHGALRRGAGALQVEEELVGGAVVAQDLARVHLEAGGERLGLDQLVGEQPDGGDLVEVVVAVVGHLEVAERAGEEHGEGERVAEERAGLHHVGACTRSTLSVLQARARCRRRAPRRARAPEEGSVA
jgi:hypothetical protein